MSMLHPEVETASAEKIRELQFQKFRKVLQTVSKSNPFYRHKFRESGVSPDDIRSLDDIRKLPFSVKKDFQDDQEQNPPYGTNLSEPIDRYIRFHQTSGTTGRPLLWLDTKESWEWRKRCAAMSLNASGLQPSDVVFFPFTFSPHVAFWGLFEGAEQLGAMVISGGGWKTTQRLRTITENQVTTVCCTPTYAVRMVEVATQQGIDIKNSHVRMLVHAGEPGALIPAVRTKTMEAWGATPFDFSGLTEVGAYGMHCQHQEGSIHINESEFIVEVIDSETLEPAPEGKVGEMVLTNLGRLGSPAIRFRTGDLVRLERIDCPCGRTFRILEDGVLGRNDDMIILRGMNIFPYKIGEIVESCLVIGEEYQMVAYTKSGMGEFKVIAEVAEGRNASEVMEELQEKIRHRFEVRIEVEAVSTGTLPRAEFKSKRFIDKR